LSHEVASKPVLDGLLNHLILRANSYSCICMIPCFSLDGYIRICLLHIGNILLFFPFSFILEVGPSVCHTILNHTMFTPAMNIGLICIHVILFMHELDTFIPCLPLGKYK